MENKALCGISRCISLYGDCCDCFSDMVVVSHVLAILYVLNICIMLVLAIVRRFHLFCIFI